MGGRDVHYRFNTVWSFAEPVDAVWHVLGNPAAWPRWWPGCVIVESLSGPATQCVGSCYRFHWQGPLPYCLVIRICITGLEPRRRMTGQVDGPIAGIAEWRLWEEGEQTKVGCEFAVSGSKSWMGYLAPLARPLFRWNHERLMAGGEQGLRRWLARQGARHPGLHAGIG